MCADLFFLIQPVNPKLPRSFETLVDDFCGPAACAQIVLCVLGTHVKSSCMCSVNPGCVRSAHCGTAAQHKCVETSSGRSTGALEKSVSDYYVITPNWESDWGWKNPVSDFCLRHFVSSHNHVKNLSQDNNIWPPLWDCSLHIARSVWITSEPSSCTGRANDWSFFIAKGHSKCTLVCLLE